MADNDLLDKPCQIFNIDDPGIPLDQKHAKDVLERGSQERACFFLW